MWHVPKFLSKVVGVARAKQTLAKMKPEDAEIWQDKFDKPKPRVIDKNS
jgi:hypothetical protein